MRSGSYSDGFGSVCFFPSFLCHLSSSLLFVCMLLMESLALYFVPFLAQLRRERIAERMKALQELVPNANKVCLSSSSLSCFFSDLFLSNINLYNNWLYKSKFTSKLLIFYDYIHAITNWSICTNHHRLGI